MINKETLLFTSTFFRGNRAALRSAVPDDALIILTAHGQLQRSNDTTFPFRQESNFWYFTGIEEPDCVLVMDRDSEYIIMPERSTSHMIFAGEVSSVELQNLSGIDAFYDEKKGWQRLSGQLRSTKRVATLPASARYLQQEGVYTNPAQARLEHRLRSYGATFSLFDIRPITASLRSVKQPAEMTALREAIDLTGRAFNVLLERGLADFTHEYEIEAEFTYAYRAQGAVHGYEPIVASGQNACTLHYIKNNALIKSGELVLIDTGAEVSQYSADITRTLSCGAITSRQRSVYEAVTDIQKQVLVKLRPGATLRELELAAMKATGSHLKNLGLIKNAKDETAIRQYYPHAVSHFLGLDVHDAGPREEALKPGMVLTVEPGIYITNESIGVRIEDNVCITETGYELLSAACRQGLGS